MSPTYGYVTKLFLENRNSNTKEIKFISFVLEFRFSKNRKTKKRELSTNLAVFLAGTDSENKNIKILHRK